MQESSASDLQFFHEYLRYKKVSDERGFSSTVADTGLANLKQRFQRSVVFYKVNSMLYKKYSSSQNYYYIKDINEILADARTVDAIEYKHAIDCITPGEHLKKFIERENYDRKMRGLVDYYRYHKEIPRVFAKSVYDLYFDHHDRKRKVEYVLITRNLKASKLNEEGKQAAEEKLKKQRSKKFEPMLDDLQGYAFNQRYYHHKNNEETENSKSLYSIYDKLNRVVGGARVSVNSFSLNSASSEIQIEIGKVERTHTEEKVPLSGDLEQRKFNFMKRKKPANSAGLMLAENQENESNRENNLLPQSAISSTRRQFRDSKELVLQLEEVGTKNLGMATLDPKTESVRESGDLLSKVKRVDSRSKEEYGTLPRNKKKQRGTSQSSSRQSRKSEDGRKRVSMERKEIEALRKNLDNKTYWKSVERSIAAEEECTVKPRSQSKKKKKQQGDTLKQGVNFNFNWTKVNKMLTNPMLINKASTISKVTAQRDKNELIQAKTVSIQKQGKNYLDQKSKVLKGYHHKVNSMLLSQINSDMAKISNEQHKSKVAGMEHGLFSRKNSLNEKDMKALFSYQTGIETKQAPKPKFISHSKKSSVYNVSNPTNHLNKKKNMKKRKHTKASSGLNCDSSIGRTFTGGLAVSSEKDSRILRSNIFDVKKASAQYSSRQHQTSDKAHKHSKSEAESIVAMKLGKSHRFGAKKLSSDWDEKTSG